MSRIAFAGYVGHPFQIQLSRALAARGHDVLHLHFSEFQGPKGPLSRRENDPKTLTIDAVSLGAPFAKYSFIRRRFQEIEIGRRFAARIEDFRPDVILADLPLDPLSLVQEASRRLGARFIFWQQDIYSEAITRIFKNKLGLAGAGIGWWYRALEKRLLAQSDSIIVIAEDFSRHIREKMGVTNVPIHVIENWALIEELPIRPKDNTWSRQHGLHDKKTVLYTGTLGMKHNPAIILNIAEAIRERPDCRMVVISEGAAVDWLKKSAAEREINNLLILGFQPFEAYSDVLGSGDVVISILEEDAGVFSVPSKILSYFCAARPVVFHGPSTNLATRIIERTGSGIVYNVNSNKNFTSQILDLLDTPEKRTEIGEKGRFYAEKTFNINIISKKFENLIKLK